MKKDLLTGNVTKTLMLFAVPMIVGNLLQQFYNIADTLIVGKYLGVNALAAVGAAYTLMTFLTSILIGLCMGSGTLFSFYFGKGNILKMKECMQVSFVFIGIISIIVNILVFVFIETILGFMQIPKELMVIIREYVFIVFGGIIFVFLYNYFAYVLRAVGNAIVPLFFLGSTAVLNIILDILFVGVFRYGVSGAATATVISQIVAGIGIGIYTWKKEPTLRFSLVGKNRDIITKEAVLEIFRFSSVASIQQSVMNFGILMIQGLVNSFGATVMAAFAAAVKIDSFAYMPAQEFGNAFSIFISQNNGAEKKERVKQGIKSAIMVSMVFCILISVLVFGLAKYLMLMFVSQSDTEIIRIGVGYLRIEGVFYCGIGILFLLYGFYRGVNRPEMSLILTIISLGTRVILAYVLASIESIGVVGIWWAIPIGWALADVIGIIYITDRGKCKR